MKSKRQWRTRTHGSRRQIGKPFILSSSQQKLKAQLPTISGRKKVIVPTVNPRRKVLLSLKQISLSNVVPSEKNPVDLETRTQYFIDMHKEGRTIPPILVHRLFDGRYQILDGHARVNAYRKLGITKIPAVENLLFIPDDTKKKTQTPVAIISSKPDVKPSKPTLTYAEKVETKPLVKLESKPPMVKKAVEPVRLSREEEMEKLKEYHRQRITKAGIRAERAGKELVTGVPREFLKLSEMYEAAKQGRGITVNVQGVPTEIPASQVKAMLSDRKRAIAGEYYLEPIELKAFSTRPWTSRPPLLEGAGSPFSRPPPIKKQRKRKKGKKFEFEGTGRVH